MSVDTNRKVRRRYAMASLFPTNNHFPLPSAVGAHFRVRGARTGQATGFGPIETTGVGMKPRAPDRCTRSRIPETASHVGSRPGSVEPAPIMCGFDFVTRNSAEGPVHPLTRVEGCLHLIVGREPCTFVKRTSVRVCRDFKPGKPFLLSNFDHVDDERPPDASPHPIWIDEEIFHLDDLTAHQPGGEPDDSCFGSDSDPCAPRCDTVVSEHEMLRVRYEMTSVSAIGEGCSAKHSA